MPRVIDIEGKEFEKEMAKREAEKDSVTAYLEKQNRIKKEKSRLNRLFHDVDPKKKKLAQSTIADIAFMAVTMEDLRETIIREGTTVDYKNGENQYGTKQSPDAQLYLQMSQKHTAAMKVLIECLPKTKDVSMKIQDDGFADFVRNRGT